jgi:hypothetical protein
MSTNAVRGIDTSVAPVDMKFEIVVVPVSDVGVLREARVAARRRLRQR